MKTDLIPLNLQFFADGELEQGAADLAGEGTVADNATEIVEEGTETAENDGDGEPQGQSDEMNRIYADARRRAEAEAERKYAQRQAAIDRQYAERFAGLKNPETGAPINSAADYFEALAAQERMQAISEMEEAGIDPSMIDRMVANNPVVQQAARTMEEVNRMQAQQMVQEDYNEIVAMDSSINSTADIEQSEGFSAAVDYVAAHPGVRLSEAWKIVNFERLSAERTNAAAQGAINQSRSKAHMSTVGGLASKDNLKEIPEGSIQQWRDSFPDKTDAELKVLYNKSVNSRAGG